MDKTGIIVGGIAGAVLTLVLFTVIMIPPAEMEKPEIVVTNGHDITTVGETLPAYTKEMSLIEIFENSEAGVVRVNVQRSEDVERPTGVGSGFVFDKKGHIITNAHVVDNANKVVVTFLDGREYKAEVIGMDQFTDVAVIKVNTDSALLQPISLGDSSNLRVGEPIAAI